ncbi:cytochrome c [Candidatus Nitrotoga sp. M5]|uniref:cytochrome c n=1 Tax=Candidatus Nitrotoga sp. M5 TaxID=2890409 RepID=UPI001EF1C767|nr:cytochrome c [Candidatus Nitrotoga sp. M5]CAH1385120.1 exported hypothetical protein [Candidatus Nitrotoga sp. M5]
MFRRLILAALFIFSGNFVNAETLLIHNATRGELLYTKHCIACHSTQIHWREKKRVTDWTSLQSEVQRWQGIAGLGWDQEEIDDVAQYLNVIYYHYPCQTDESSTTTANICQNQGDMTAERRL